MIFPELCAIKRSFSRFSYPKPQIQHHPLTCKHSTLARNYNCAKPSPCCLLLIKLCIHRLYWSAKMPSPLTAHCNLLRKPTTHNVQNLLSVFLF